MARALRLILDANMDDVKYICKERGLKIDFKKLTFTPDVKYICKERGLEIDFKTLATTSDVRTFEEALILPLYPKEFKDLDDYYEKSSSHQYLKDVQVPLLTLCNLNDPLITPELANIPVEASKSNPNIFCVTTRRGGHLGWLTGWDGRWWKMDLILAFIDSILSDGGVGAAQSNTPMGGDGAVQSNTSMGGNDAAHTNTPMCVGDTAQAAQSKTPMGGGDMANSNPSLNRDDAAQFNRPMGVGDTAQAAQSKTPMGGGDMANSNPSVSGDGTAHIRPAYGTQLAAAQIANQPSAGMLRVIL
eukprot:gene11547-34262_t